MQMKKQLRYALMAVLLTGLAGCGLKGPLYFPTCRFRRPKPAKPPVQTGDQVQKNQQEQSGSQQNRRWSTSNTLFAVASAAAKSRRIARPDSGV